MATSKSFETPKKCVRHVFDTIGRMISQSQVGYPNFFETTFYSDESHSSKFGTSLSSASLHVKRKR